MPRKKIKLKKNKSGLVKIATLTTKSFSNVISNYKKNKELKRIKDIKLQKLSDKNQILKEKKDLKIWEEKISKESRKIKLYEEEIKNREKDLKLQEDRLKIENERLIRKDEDLIQIRKELVIKEKELKSKEDQQILKVLIGLRDILKITEFMQ